MRDRMPVIIRTNEKGRGSQLSAVCPCSYCLTIRGDH